MHRDLRTTLPKWTLFLITRHSKPRVMLFGQRTGQSLITKMLVKAHEVKVQFQRARVMLFRKSPRNCRRVSSLGLNLIYEGLLLGMQAEGHRDSCSRSSPS
jgi:hypothetical protein